MGFTETQAEHLCAGFSQFRGSTAKHSLSTITALFVLGLNATSMLKVFEKCPELYTVREAQLQQRINNLRKLGFVEGKIKISRVLWKRCRDSSGVKHVFQAVFREWWSITLKS